MRSILDFKNRGKFGDSSYRGNYSGYTLIALNKRYKFQNVSDYMKGSDTTGDAAKYLNISNHLSIQYENN